MTKPPVTFGDPSNRDPVLREILVEAGPRPEPPETDLSLIRSAAREEWLATVERRQARFRRRRLAWAAGIAAGLALAIVGLRWNRSLESASSVAVARVTWGSAVALEAGSTSEATTVGSGARVAVGSTVRTGPGAPGVPDRVALALSSGVRLRLDARSQIFLVAEDTVRLEKGALYVDRNPTLAADNTLVVLTPWGPVRELGTQYEVRLDSSESSTAIRIRVREGRVRIQRPEGSLEAGEGEELTVRRDGSTERSLLEPSDPSWQWVVATSPGFSIDGRRLSEAVRWLTRETGWELSVEDPEAASQLERCVLSGPGERTPVGELPGLVFPSCGVEFRLVEGRLVLFSPS